MGLRIAVVGPNDSSVFVRPRLRGTGKWEPAGPSPYFRRLTGTGKWEPGRSLRGAGLGELVSTLEGLSSLGAVGAVDATQIMPLIRGMVTGMACNLLNEDVKQRLRVRAEEVAIDLLEETGIDPYAPANAIEQGLVTAAMVAADYAADRIYEEARSRVCGQQPQPTYEHTTSSGGGQSQPTPTLAGKYRTGSVARFHVTRNVWRIYSPPLTAAQLLQLRLATQAMALQAKGLRGVGVWVPEMLRPRMRGLAAAPPPEGFVFAGEEKELPPDVQDVGKEDDKGPVGDEKPWYKDWKILLPVGGVTAATLYLLLG